MVRRRVVNRAASQRQKPAAAPVVPDPTAVVARATRGNNRWDALEGVKGAIELERSVIRRRDRQVRAARSAGATWTELSKILGVSPQAVQQRYGRSPDL
jgi:hypothetical protein